MKPDPTPVLQNIPVYPAPLRIRFRAQLCHTTGETYECDREFKRKHRTNVCNSADVEDSSFSFYVSPVGSRNGGHGAMPHPLWPSNKKLKPNFQAIISQTDNGCSLLSLILAKLLLLDILATKIFLPCPW